MKALACEDCGRPLEKRQRKYCRLCGTREKNNLRWRQRHRDRQREYARRYYETERGRQKRREWYLANRDYVLRYGKFRRQAVRDGTWQWRDGPQKPTHRRSA